MIDIFSGKEKVFYSHDSVDDDSNNNYPLDFINSITPNGLPPHELRIKKNCPVILLRNLDPHNGLCNGTRLVVKGFDDNAIDAEIVNGQMLGKGFSFLGYRYAHRRILHFLSSSKGNNSQSDSVLP